MGRALLSDALDSFFGEGHLPSLHPLMSWSVGFLDRPHKMGMLETGSEAKSVHSPGMRARAGTGASLLHALKTPQGRGTA